MPQISPIMWPLIIIISSLLLISTISSIINISSNENPIESNIVNTNNSWNW